TQEREAEASPIADLVWLKKFEYVRDEQCPIARGTSVSDFADSAKSAATCAAVVTTATLKQKSSPKDATPENYKLNNLLPAATASGRNETILFFSQANGLLMRASKTADQSMDVTISLADATNRIHYAISAESRSRVLFLQNSPS